MERGIDFKELEKNNLFSILMFLYKDGPCIKSALYSKWNTSSLPLKISYLIELGLISEDQRRFENNTKYIDLTEKGKTVARKIAEMEILMNGLEPAEDGKTNHGSPETEGGGMRT